MSRFARQHFSATALLIDLLAIIAATLVFGCSPILAQTNPGSSPLTILKGGTGQVTADAARGSSGLNIEGYTGHGDSIYSILPTDRVVGTTATLTASRTWTLPAASAVNPGQEIMVADFFGGVSSVNTLVIARSGSDTINGGTSVSINSAYGAYRLRSDGTSKWSALISSASASTSTAIKTPLDYGAACDGTTDDSNAIQDWLDGIKANAFVGWGLPGRTCLFGNNTHGNVAAPGLIGIRSGTTILGNGMTFKLKNSATGSSNAGFVTANGTIDQVNGATDIYIERLFIDGNRANQTNSMASGAMLYVIGSTRVYLRDTKTVNSRSDGLYIGGNIATGGRSTFVSVINHEAGGNYRNGMSIVGLDRGHFVGGIFNSTSNTNNDGPQCGVDFESDAGVNTLNSNITVFGGSAVGNGGTLSTTGGSGWCFFGPDPSGIAVYGITGSSNQRWGVAGGVGMTPGTVRLHGVSGASNGSGLVDTANIRDFFPTGISVGAADSGGAGFRYVRVPN
ncbi:hypothetical protein [Bradyrhizobium yuanmingense]|uniref:hypothetical protein n=1 Tax=Bradyrhizobium yuanmingense TaxID=108015 RepID=UPI0023B888A1|nr:hypothetical protein [Bradyrhizobium yuanmingense]MDF0581265.1 hypothetical protein [Bradyrhizobium yuanmingense]